MSSIIAGSETGRPVIPVGIVLTSLVVLVATVFTGLPVKAVAPIVCLVVTITVLYKVALSWRALLALVIMVIIFIPIRRYTLPMSLPFELEPFRIVVMVVSMGWLASLLTDRRVVLRPTGFGGPLRLLAFAWLGSIIVNPTLVLTVEGHVIKQLSYFASFIIVLFLIVSVVRTHADIDRLLRVLVGSGAIVAFFALIEANLGYNIFHHLSTFMPVLKEVYIPNDTPDRGGRLRTYGSAQHPIELGAIFVMLVPLAAYLARRHMQRRWWLAGVLLLMGALATLSRTSMLMLLIVVLTFLILRPRQTRRLWPALVPLLAVVHLAIPGTLGSLQQSFFPKGGILKEQAANPGYKGSGRLADLGPSLEKVSREPLFGQGFGTRITNGVGSNAPVLDDQWLSTLVETGTIGTFAWLWLFVGALRRFGKAARRDQSDRGWLLAAVTASMAAFMVGMITFDAFSFTQVTFVLFIVLGLGQVMAGVPQTAPVPAEAPVRRIPAPASAS